VLQIHSVVRSLKSIDLAYGMVIESTKEQELPEVMLFCCKLAKIDNTRSVAFPPRRAEQATAANGVTVEAAGSGKGEARWRWPWEKPQ